MILTTAMADFQPKGTLKCQPHQGERCGREPRSGTAFIQFIQLGYFSCDPHSYKEPGQLKLSMLEADKDNDSDDAFEGSTKGKASQHKRKHSDVLSQYSPAPSQRRKTDKTGRLLFDTNENSLFGVQSAFLCI